MRTWIMLKNFTKEEPRGRWSRGWGCWLPPAPCHSPRRDARCRRRLQKYNWGSLDMPSLSWDWSWRRFLQINTWVELYNLMTAWRPRANDWLKATNSMLKTLLRTRWIVWRHFSHSQSESRDTSTSLPPTLSSSWSSISLETIARHYHL